MQYAMRINLGFIGCQQQANLQCVVDDAHQIPICLGTEFSEFGEKCCADSGAITGLKDPVRSLSY